MLRQFSKTIFKNVSWLVKWTPYPYHSGLTAINLLWLLFPLLPSFFGVQGRERGGSVLKQISDIARFYSSTSFSCYSITYFLSVDSSFSCYWNCSWTVPWWCYKGGLFWLLPCSLHGGRWAGLQRSRGGQACCCDVHGPVTSGMQRCDHCSPSL